MMRIGLAGLVSVFVLGACATAKPEKVSYSVIPQVEVTMKSTKKKAAQANYRPAPAQAPLTGSGGASR